MEPMETTQQTTPERDQIRAIPDWRPNTRTLHLAGAATPDIVDTIERARELQERLARMLRQVTVEIQARALETARLLGFDSIAEMSTWFDARFEIRYDQEAEEVVGEWLPNNAGVGPLHRREAVSVDEFRRHASNLIRERWNRRRTERPAGFEEIPTEQRARVPIHDEERPGRGTCRAVHPERPDLFCHRPGGHPLEDDHRAFDASAVNIMDSSITWPATTEEVNR